MIDKNSIVQRSPSLVDQVETGLLAQILNGEHAPGSMLPSVQALSTSWGVSRTVLREALARLASSGHIISQQGKGVFVSHTLPPRPLEFTTPTEDSDIIAMIELRLALEAESAGLAAKRRSSEDLLELEKTIELMETSLAGGNSELGLEADVQFHQLIFKAAGNQHFETLFNLLVDSVMKSIAVARANSALKQGQGSKSQEEHRAIFNAIQAQDTRAARAAARIHIQNTASRLGMELNAEDAPQAA
ncbi:FadR/GntR family transcriptional regulator [Aureimonas fodinaquatilis]|nr:FadR/GntR family transcriptional regulator [Aureimonas fodinaquatilis]